MSLSVSRITRGLPIFACVIVLGCAGLTGGCSKPVHAPVVETQATPPNVVLIIADALRFDALFGPSEVLGDAELMPNVAKFAAESWNFRNASVQATWTKPSMVSILTSLYPEVHQVLFGIHDTIYEGQPLRADVLPKSIESMASYLKRNGFATSGIQTNANLQATFGVAEGFDTYEFHKYPEVRATGVTDRAIAELGKFDSRFFLYVHYMDTHAPYNPPEPFRSQLKVPPLSPDDKKLLDDYSSYYIDHVLCTVGLRDESKSPDLSPAGREYIREMYKGEARYLDSEVGRLLAHIKKTHPNTIIVFTADHGEELWEHGAIGHAKTVYQELTHVPMFIHVPGATPKSIDTPVETIDVLPTCASLLSLTASPNWQGIDLSKPESFSPNRAVFSSTQMSLPGSNCNLASVTVNDTKMIENRHNGPTRVVFDLLSDPNEKSPAPLQDMQPWQPAIDAFNARNESNPLRQATPETGEIDPETAEGIRAIGYATGDDKD